MTSCAFTRGKGDLGGIHTVARPAGRDVLVREPLGGKRGAHLRDRAAGRSRDRCVQGRHVYWLRHVVEWRRTSPKSCRSSGCSPIAAATTSTPSALGARRARTAADRRARRQAVGHEERRLVAVGGGALAQRRLPGAGARTARRHQLGGRIAAAALAVTARLGVRGRGARTAPVQPGLARRRRWRPANAWSPRAGTRPRGCGTRRPASRSSAPSSIRTGWRAPRSAPTARAWSPRAMTRPRGCLRRAPGVPDRRRRCSFGGHRASPSDPRDRALLGRRSAALDPSRAGLHAR